MSEKDTVEWLRMMERHSVLIDCRPHFARIADEMESLRMEVAGLRNALAGAHRDPAKQVAS
jgi:hypothetical protein